MLDEAASCDVLEQIGLPVAKHTVGNVEDLVNGTRVDLTFPVAVKALSGHLPHKSDSGGVVLGVSTDRELLDAAARIRSDVDKHAQISIQRVLVQENDFSGRGSSRRIPCRPGRGASGPCRRRRHTRRGLRRLQHPFSLHRKGYQWASVGLWLR
ncbi:acetate--CoA ligase family protein [Rhodococcus fascians]|nr:acetate--CoA ligase family protein [Rhodococcus fascians]MBY3999458.1 acetate--CoA ligase family protein [Rhodococcus fascians]MBY4004991.1 acetate--CoA ligase family protein [Rhodococcus fascians]MBY4010136.1 acetate--CoA ligase family protein [Rhodococcus fascians]MBY4020198.1 acetate--CoA ligase family protein [Rhodococcus fascians]